MQNWLSRFKSFLSQCLPHAQPDQPASQESSVEVAFSLETTYLEKPRVVKITTHGLLTTGANSRLVAAGLAASRQYGTDAILVDHRDIEIGMDFVNVYDLPEHNRLLGVGPQLRVALLYSPSEQMSKIFRFYENCSVFRDFQHRVFTNEDEALDWLA